MNYLTVKETAQNWGISERRVIELCNSGRIAGSIKRGMSWQIPSDTEKPIDKRTKLSKKYEHSKTIVVAGIDSEIGISLSKILLQHNYKIIGLYQEGNTIRKELKNKNIKLINVDYLDKKNLLDVCNNINTYLDGFVFLEIYFNLEDMIDFDYDLFEKGFKVNVFAMNLLVRELVKKMNYESSIVIMNSIEAYRGSFGASSYASSQAAKVNLTKTFANIFTEMYGVRINSVMSGWIGGVMENDDSFNKAKNIIPMKRLGHTDEIADDIFLMLTRHKYSTGSELVSDGGYLAVDEQSKSEDLDSGKFYRLLNKYFTEAKKGSNMFALSMMLENEWNESAPERRFRQDNIDAVNRGVNLERIYIFEKRKAQEYKNNPSIEIFMGQKKMKNYFVDLNFLKKNRKDLLDIIKDGMIGIDEELLLVDIDGHGESRGYITFNKKEIEKALFAWNELKKYAVDIKEIIK